MAGHPDADTKARSEDLYLPYKPKRRTKAQIAREAGLEPLALGLRDNPTRACPRNLPAAFVDAERAWRTSSRARRRAAILMEQFSEDAALVGELRDWLWRQRGQIRARGREGKQNEGAKFRLFSTTPSRSGRFLAPPAGAVPRANEASSFAKLLEPRAQPGGADAEPPRRAIAGFKSPPAAARPTLAARHLRPTWRAKPPAPRPGPVRQAREPRTRPSACSATT